MKHVARIATLAGTLVVSSVALGNSRNMAREHLPDQLLVKLASAADTAPLKRVGAKVLHVFKSGALQISLPTKGSDAHLAMIADILAADKGVAYAELNTVMRLDRMPNDPDFGRLYGLFNDGNGGGKPGADIHAPAAWDVTIGSSAVVVGVIDTGVDYTHPDLAGNIWKNPGETGLDAAGKDKATNGVDDDGNGFVDDWHGWDFVNDDNDPMDDQEHGSHVSGTIGAHGDDGVGLAGVNWKVSIVPIKFLNAFGSGSLADAIKSVEYATALGVTLTSNSWGGGDYSEALGDAIEAANQKGILFIAAAGNTATDDDIAPHYPSSYPHDNIIAVAATDKNDNLATFSCFGRTTVDVAAPGVDIWSTIPGGGYNHFSGTSMATPHVAGVAALIKAAYPDATAAQIKARIINTVDAVPALAAYTASGGRINAFNALEADSLPPAAVAALHVTDTATTSIALVFTGSGDDGAVGRASRYEARVSDTPITTEAAWEAAARVALAVETANADEIHARALNLAFDSAGFVSVRAVDNVGNFSALADSVPFAVRRIVPTSANTADSLDGVDHEATWGIEVDPERGNVFSDSPAGDYGEKLDASLTLAPVAVPSGDVTLMFMTQIALENTYDFGYVEVSADGGSWQKVEILTGESDRWVKKIYNLSGIIPAVTTSLQVRFRVLTDYSISRAGWKIDDVQIWSPAN